MSGNGKGDIKIGEYLVDRGIISSVQLNSALELQKFNKNTVVGELLVTEGSLTKEDLIMAMEMYMIETSAIPEHVDEWLDQDEVDSLIEKLRSRT
jgi:hypothetical protein